MVLVIPGFAEKFKSVFAGRTPIQGQVHELESSGVAVGHEKMV
jgi:hypothetical protein